VLAGCPKGRPDGAQHQPEPEEEAHEESRLPDAPEVEILVALMPQVERDRVAQLVVDAEVLARKRSPDHEHQCHEQQVDAQPLPRGVLAADERRDEEPRRQPRCGDPEEAELEMPRARHAVGEPA